jgi:hypothetical protein
MGSTNHQTDWSEVCWVIDVLYGLVLSGCLSSRIAPYGEVSPIFGPNAVPATSGSRRRVPCRPISTAGEAGSTWGLKGSGMKSVSIAVFLD